MRKSLIIHILFIVLWAMLPNKVSASVQNLYIEQDENYNKQLLISKSIYTDIKSLDQSGKNTEVVSPINAENRYLVKFASDVSLEEINSLIMNYSYKIIGKSSNRLFRIEIDNIEEFTIISKQLVEWIELDTQTKQDMIPNDQYLSEQWAINALSLPKAWDISRGSDTTYVAVIDSGVSRYHQDLSNNQILNGWDIILDDYVNWDAIGHGTEVTGIIAATSNNYQGISGTCWNVGIIPLAVAYYDGTIYTSDVVQAIYLAADIGCKVINISLGGSSYSISEDTAIQYAIGKGCIVVASAGNDSNSSIKYPASLDNVISVGSINENYTHSSFSNYNSYVDISAPGENILTTYDDYYNNSYYFVDGTSFSAPYVSGIAALAATAMPDITPSQFKNAIIASSTDLGTVGYDNYYGYGLINAEELLKYVTQATNVPVTGVSLDKSNISISVGLSDTLTSTVTPSNATNKNITWQSSNTSVATVDLTGNVTGVGSGTAVIRVTSNADPTKYAECSVTVTSSINFSATPIVQIGINHEYGDSAGIFIGFKDIRDAQGELVLGANLADYQIELVYDHDQATVYDVFDVYDEAHMGQFIFTKEVNPDELNVADTIYEGTGNFNKLFFVPLALTGASTSTTDVVIKFTNLIDSNFTKIIVPDVTLTFQRGKIVNDLNISSSIADAVAGLQYLAKIVDSGLDPGEVNVINMASILPPEAGITGITVITVIKPSVKDVVALMQKLVGLRDDTFQITNINGGNALSR